jgi:hypothetical protein
MQYLLYNNMPLHAVPLFKRSSERYLNKNAISAKK